MSEMEPVKLMNPDLPPAQGLYDPSNEKDSCGVGFIADMKNRRSHEIVRQGLQILHNLDHRGAVGADPKLGDGCGILVQIPHRFFAEECAKLGFALPAAGDYAVGHFFMPQDPDIYALCKDIVERTIVEEGQVPARLARGPGRQQRSWRGGEGDRAAPDAGLHRQGRGRRRRRRVRAPALRAAQVGVEQGLPAAGPGDGELLPRLAVGAHHRLQGHGAGEPARRLLQGPAGPALRERAGARPPALRHQHLPVLASRPPLPDGGAQRRDQHAARQRQLDGRAAGLGRLAPVRERHLEAWPISYEGQSDTACFDNALEFLVRAATRSPTP